LRCYRFNYNMLLFAPRGERGMHGVHLEYGAKGGDKGGKQSAIFESDDSKSTNSGFKKKTFRRKNDEEAIDYTLHTGHSIFIFNTRDGYRCIGGRFLSHKRVVGYQLSLS
ncbi:MAG TPA: hypothetical protein PLA74_12970, partial [Syntrophales bacterium]|nr:hypothetical protein [Syntrophales bacterium]